MPSFFFFCAKIFLPPTSWQPSKFLLILKYPVLASPPLRNLITYRLPCSLKSYCSYQPSSLQLFSFMFTSSTEGFLRVRFMMYSAFISSGWYKCLLDPTKVDLIDWPGAQDLYPPVQGAYPASAAPAGAARSTLWLWWMGEGTQWPRMTQTPGRLPTGKVKYYHRKKPNSVHAKQ